MSLFNANRKKNHDNSIPTYLLDVFKGGQYQLLYFFNSITYYRHLELKIILETYLICLLLYVAHERVPMSSRARIRSRQIPKSCSNAYFSEPHWGSHYILITNTAVCCFLQPKIRKTLLSTYALVREFAIILKITRLVEKRGSQEVQLWHDCPRCSI